MAPLRLIFVLLLAGVLPAAAQVPAPVRQPAEIRFVPATGDGTVSLGIYDGGGRLVRVLCDEWTFNRFRVGLNGLSTDWDGLDDAGRPVRPGHYAARGFIVGAVGIAGDAFHFNDWIETEDSPRIVRVVAQQLLSGGDMLLAARLAGGTGALVRYSPQSEARWRTVVSEARPQPATSAQLAVADTMAFVLLDGGLRAVGLEDGAEVPLPVPYSGVKAVAARGDRLAVLGTDGLGFYRLPDFTPQGPVVAPPVEVASLALTAGGAVAAGSDGSLWRWRDAWSRLESPEAVRGVAGGRGETFWVLEERKDGGWSVAQCSPDEGRLAEWIPKADEGTPGALSAATEGDHFAVNLSTPEVQRTVAIQRGAAGWEFVVDKKITASAGFGWADGHLVAAGGEVPREVKVKLAPNPLDSTAPTSLVLRTTAGRTGTGLATTDGLPLFRVSESPAYARVMIVSGPAADSARFFQGDGASVEEFELSRLGEITAFDAGGIEMGPTGEAVLPPTEDPEEPSAMTPAP